MADIALDVDALGHDRSRYAGLLAQAQQQIAAWNERADHLHQTVDGLDRLLAMATDDPARDGGTPRGRAQSPGAATPAAGTSAPPAPGPGPDAPGAPVNSPLAATAGRGPRPRRTSPTGPGRAPSTAAEPAATGPATARSSGASKRTDALRLVLEADPERSWALAELLDALGARGLLPASRRPEEGVRISLKRLAERGGAVRTEDGRWHAGGAHAQAGESPLPSTPLPGPTSNPGTAADHEAAPVPGPAPSAAPELAPLDARPEPSSTNVPEPTVTSPAKPALPPRPASFGRPVGATITEL